MYEALIPRANMILSKATIGINEIHTTAGKLNAQIQIAPPTAWIVNVAPKLLAKRKLLRKGQTINGINQ